MKSPQITWISASDPPQAFPDVEKALDFPEGLLAAGGDLSLERLLYAYQHGIFPWFSDGQPILWWSPDPRCVLVPGQFHVARRFSRSLQKCGFEITFNSAFEQVISACAADRPGQDGTWITPTMQIAYRDLHVSGWAHSVETWHEGELIGGIYGVAIGKVFFGESMFSRRTNASKVALLALCKVLAKHDFALLDCQVASRHLASLGATLMPRQQFTDVLKNASAQPASFGEWPTGRQKAKEFRLPRRVNTLQ